MLYFDSDMKETRYRNDILKKKETTIEVVTLSYYMALACGRYNARFDWLIVTEL